jgi:rhodanese-related sulfurtransferase
MSGRRARACRRWLGSCRPARASCSPYLVSCLPPPGLRRYGAARTSPAERGRTGVRGRGRGRTGPPRARGCSGGLFAPLVEELAGTGRFGAFRDEVLACIGTKNIVDVRSPQEFSGQILAPAQFPQEQPQKGGHVPTAVNVPVVEGGSRGRTLRSDDELRALHRDTGVDLSGERDTIIYCRVGERSAHLARAARAARPAAGEELRRLLGRIRLPGRRADREVIGRPAPWSGRRAQTRCTARGARLLPAGAVPRPRRSRPSSWRATVARGRVSVEHRTAGDP